MTLHKPKRKNKNRLWMCCSIKPHNTYCPYLLNTFYFSRVLSWKILKCCTFVHILCTMLLHVLLNISIGIRHGSWYRYIGICPLTLALRFYLCCINSFTQRKQVFLSYCMDVYLIIGSESSCIAWRYHMGESVVMGVFRVSIALIFHQCWYINEK